VESPKQNDVNVAILFEIPNVEQRENKIATVSAVINEFVNEQANACVNPWPEPDGAKFLAISPTAAAGSITIAVRGEYFA